MAVGTPSFCAQSSQVQGSCRAGAQSRSTDTSSIMAWELLQMSFYDGTAELATRNGFLDVRVHAVDTEPAHRRAQSAPPRSTGLPPGGEDCEDVEEAGKPISREISNSTASTDCQWLDAPDAEFDRQITQQSTVGMMSTCSQESGMTDSPTVASRNEKRGDLASVHTVMIKNIPCRCDENEVLRAVDSLGFKGMYNFFYLPMNRRHRQGIGYAFINFRVLGTAEHFKEAICGYRFPGRRSTKQVEVAPAKLQGLEAMDEYFRRTPVRDMPVRPLM
ncbi:ML5 [Symbiodinium necroappetens]|uniref:ML5 protein n=1 Tax=Symbiodinium necroappetens TaxID=1628268 RepID=A0A812JZ95_9DINO|nr:ML5 [Symbiodinium necroappetens]